MQNKQQHDDSSTRSNGNAPLLRMTGIRKRFPGVQALSGASFDLFSGEIHALVGENGAGKSTLIKILTGAQLADEGSIEIDGRPVTFHSPLEAQQAGIATIYQEYTLIPTLSVKDNLFLGREHTRGMFIDHAYEKQKARDIFAQLGIAINIDAEVRTLPIAQQQLIEIGRALVSNARILVMDEPTAALTPKEVTNLFQILKELTNKGIGIIFISHRLDEVLGNANRITVMRDGATIDTRTTANYSRQSLIEQMVGRTLEQEYPKRVKQIGEPAFEVRNVSGRTVRDLSFTIHRGEIVGFAGLLGAGLTQTARLLFGADRKEVGEIILNGKPVTINSPVDAIKEKICLLTEDRKTQGLILKASAKENFSLSNLTNWSRSGWINQKQESSRFQSRVQELNIRLFGAEQRAETLSGGNQQKLLIARWLEMNSEVIIFDEPTRGIDVGAKYEIYTLINSLASQGKMILLMSSEMTELLGMCDRILVMRNGRITGEIVDVINSRQEEIMALAV
jgi:ABC-type sugar transport system ATPase subunit